MLSRLVVKGFKSLADVEVFLPRLTVLFGPNAAGKSNLLEAVQAVSKAVLGRHIKQILLLHIGAFDAVMLDELLTAYRQAGVTMIGLTEAMADPVYKIDPDIVWDGELIFLLQVARARKLLIPPEPAIPLRKLSAVCR